MLALALSLTAFAQESDNGFDAHGFDLVSHDGDPRDPLTIWRPGAFTQGDFYVAMLADYADSPLVRVTQGSAGGDPEVAMLLDDVATGNFAAGVAVHDNLRLDVIMPVHFVSNSTENGYEGPAPGDLRAAVSAVVIRPAYVEHGGGFGLGATGYVSVPTGTPDRFLGNGALGGGGEVAATWEQWGFTATGALGTAFMPAVELGNLNRSDGLTSKLALGYSTPTTGVTAEVHALAPFSKAALPGTGRPAEALLSLTSRLDSGVSITLGGGSAISAGAGAARYRAFFGIGYGKVAPPRPLDRDALGEAVIGDRCPDEPETDNGWKDDDGCADVLGEVAIRVVYKGKDVLGAELEVTGPDVHDKITSSNKPASYTAVPGSQWSGKANLEAECLKGTGSATAGESSAEVLVEMAPYTDAQVRFEITGPAGAALNIAESTEPPRALWSSEHPTCVPGNIITIGADGTALHPIGHGTHSVTVDVPGYKTAQKTVQIAANDTGVVRIELEPALVVMEKTQIRILDKVHFETNKAIIKPDSFDLLNQVADTILAHPDVGHVEVAGHTDDQGSDKYNQDLSQRRAESVRTYLIGRGIPPDQLLAMGYGESAPIDTNKTEDGRAANRRVEFNLVDQKDPALAPQIAPTP